MLLQFFGLFTNISILHDNVSLVQVGHGFDAVVIFIKGGGYYFWSIGFEVLDNGVLDVAVSVKLFILWFYIQFFVMCVSWCFWSTQLFLLISNIDIQSKGSVVGLGVREEFRMLLFWEGAGAAFLSSSGGGTGD